MKTRSKSPRFRYFIPAGHPCSPSPILPSPLYFFPTSSHKPTTHLKPSLIYSPPQACLWKAGCLDSKECKPDSCVAIALSRSLRLGRQAVTIGSAFWPRVATIRMAKKGGGRHGPYHRFENKCRKFILKGIAPPRSLGRLHGFEVM